MLIIYASCAIYNYYILFVEDLNDFIYHLTQNNIMRKNKNGCRAKNYNKSLFFLYIYNIKNIYIIIRLKYSVGLIIVGKLFFVQNLYDHLYIYIYLFIISIHHSNQSYGNRDLRKILLSLRLGVLDAFC